MDLSDSGQVTRVWDEMHLLASLQGTVNRDAPRLYVRLIRNGGRNLDDFWLDVASQGGQWLDGAKRIEAPSLEELVARYRSFVDGVVLYDSKVPATSNVASSIAGIEDLLAVRYDPSPESVYSRFVVGGPKLPVVRRLVNEDGTSLFTGQGTIPDTKIPSTGSAKCDAYLWLKARYIDTGRASPLYMGYYIDAYWLTEPRTRGPYGHQLCNHDFVIAKRGCVVDLDVWEDETPVDDRQQKPGTDRATLCAMLRSLYDRRGPVGMLHIAGFTPWSVKYTTFGGAGGKHDPVPTEWEFVRVVSAYNGFIDADAEAPAAMANASFWQHFPLQACYPQRKVTRDELIQRGYLSEDGKVRVDDHEFILFYVGDYDSAGWVYQMLPAIWNDPKRGQLPLMWCVSPVLERRAPMVLDYLRRTATPDDYFAAADNGAGYLNPGMLQEPRAISGLPSGLDAWAEHCLPFYARWGLSITGFVIDGYAPGLNAKGLACYARFSPDGIVPQKVPEVSLYGDMPVLRAVSDLVNDPKQSAQMIVDHVNARAIPFHWFRGILKGASWYEEVYRRAREMNPKIELVDGPTYFALLRAWLQEQSNSNG